jgi:hypothetical protein
MTSRAIPAEKLDSAVAQEQLTAARARPADSEETLDLRERSEQQARAQMRIARKLGN